MSMTGDGSNRWFDKSFTSIAFPGGVAGVNVEHSVLDATVRSDMPRSVQFETHIFSCILMPLSEEYIN